MRKRRGRLLFSLELFVFESDSDVDGDTASFLVSFESDELGLILNGSTKGDDDAGE